MVIDNDLMSLVTSSQMKSGNNYGTGMLIIHPETGKLLLGKRTDTHNMCSPGGKVELGESPLQGVIRETKEESNIKVNQAFFYDLSLHTADNGKNWVSFMFICNDWEGEIKNQESEVEPWDWYTVDEALEMDLFPPTKKSIERAIEAGVLTVGLDDNGLYTVGEPTGSYIPFVECPSTATGVHDGCCCAYSFEECDNIFTKADENNQLLPWD